MREARAFVSLPKYVISLRSFADISCRKLFNIDKAKSTEKLSRPSFEQRASNV